MAQHIDLNKPPQGLGSSITPDWTSLNNQSNPYYLKAEEKTVNGETLVLENRYVVTVVTDYKSAGKTRQELAERLDKLENKEKGFIRILNFYDKNPGENKQSLLQSVIVEGWDIKPRPNCRLKILVSISANLIDPLPGIVEGNLGLEDAAFKLTLNTEDFYKKINNVRGLLDKYDAETRSLFGRIPGLSFKSQSTKMNQTIPALAKLMLDNEYEYSRGKDQEIQIGWSADYQPSYVILRDNKCYKPLDKNFDNFRRTVSFSNSRNNKLLHKIDDLNKIVTDLDQVPMQEFIDKYIFNPPKFDFSTAKSFSKPETAQIKKEKEKANEKTAKTYSDYTLEERTQGSKEFKEKLATNLESASEFVGDNIIGGLRELSNLVPSVNSLYGDVLNKAPIRALIEAALECLNFRGLEFLEISKQFLNQAASLAEDIKRTVFDIPTIYLKDDLPITDYLDGIYESIKNGIIQSLLSTLFNIVIELIKMLLDFCKECALQNETNGRGRFDGLNFGGMSIGNVLGAGAQSFTAAAVGAIGTGITSTRFAVPGGTSTSVAEQQQKVVASTERYANNPLMMPGAKELYNATHGTDYKNYIGDEKLQEDLTNQANQAKEEMSGFLDASSRVLTPAEAANMMLGCGASQDAIDAVKNLASNYPTVAPLIQTDENVLDLFNNIGKFAGFPVILDTVKEITDRLPEEFICLCDPDDTALRENLLSQKDMDPELIKEQIDASRARDKRRLEELNALLQKDNILDGLVPPIYCSYDPKTKTTKPGLINRDHPKFTFTLDQTLNTLYDSVATTFNRDVDGYLPTVSLTPTVEKLIPRTIERTINNQVQIMFNPEFLDLVGKGQYSFGAIVPGAVGSDGAMMQNAAIPPNANFTNIHWLGNGPDIQTNTGFTVGASPGSTPDENNLDPTVDFNVINQAIGMTRPFPESERLYEAVNRNADFYDPSNENYRKPEGYGGRSNPNDYYSKKYGYSPVPIITKERGQEAFAPGFKEAYRTFCYTQPDDFGNELALNKLNIFNSAYPVNQQQAQNFKFDVPNKLLDNLNIDLETLKGSVTSDFFNPVDTRNEETQSEINEGFQSALAGLFGKINDLGFSLNYYVPHQFQYNGYDSVDEFTFVVAADTPTAFVEEAGGPEQLELNAIVSGPNEKINRDAISCLESRNITSDIDQNITPQDSFFKKLIQNSMAEGPVVYSNGEKINREAPSFGSVVSQLALGAAFGLPDNILDTVNLGGLAGYKFYDEVWRDIFCSFTNQVGSDSNPFFDLANLNALEFSPMRTADQECPPHLLDIDTIKNRIMEEYQVIQCFEASFPNTDGLGSNKDNPFEKANLSGTVLLILRTYIVEMFLKALHVFYWFRYKTPDDVDPLMVLYVGRYITSEIEKQGYFTEFEAEVLDIYNRNVELPVDQEGNTTPETNYDVAIKFLVRQQIWSVANRISKMVGSRGDTSLDAILLEEWIRMEQIQKTQSEPRLDKPCTSASEDIEYISDAMLDALTTGELSGPGIAASQEEVYKAPLGYVFRKYFSRSNNQQEGIWSLNDDPTYITDPTKKLRDGSELGNKLTSNSIFSFSNSKSNTNRELSLISSTQIDPLGTFFNDFPNAWIESGEAFRGLRSRGGLQDIEFPLHVSDAEKEAIHKFIKIIAMAARPSAYTDNALFPGGTLEVPTSTGGTEVYYPGKLFQIRFNDRPNALVGGTVQTLRATNQGQTLNNLSNNSLTDFGMGFSTLFYPYRQSYGVKAYEAGGRIGRTAYPANTFYRGSNRVEIINEIAFNNSSLGDVLELPGSYTDGVWVPRPNTSDVNLPFILLDPLNGYRRVSRNNYAASSAGPDIVNKYLLRTPNVQPGPNFIDGPTRDFFNDNAGPGGRIQIAGDDWRFGNSSFASDDTVADFNVAWDGQNYSSTGKGNIYKFGTTNYWLGTFYNGSDNIEVAVENFAPRTIKDFNNNSFTFIWRFARRDWSSEINNSTTAVIKRLQADPWMYWGPQQNFTHSPRYYQYGIPRFASNGYYTDPTAQGRDTSIPLSDYPNNAAYQDVLLYANSELGSQSILNPTGERGNYHAKLFFHALGHVQDNNYNYVSLLDLDPLSILNVLKWEKGQVYEDPRFNMPYAGTFSNRRVTRTYNLTPDGQRLVDAYDNWIRDAELALQSFQALTQARNQIRSNILKKVNNLPPARRPMEAPLTCDYKNGGLILEPYIRAVELNTDSSSPYNENVTPIGLQQKSANKNKVDTAIATKSYGRTGIINIEEFDDFVHEIATGLKVERKEPDPEGRLAEACGQNLGTSPRNYQYDGLILGDYFEEVHLGFRLSYVLPLGRGETTEIVDDPGLLDFLQQQGLNITPDDVKKTKAYAVRESAGGQTRTLNIIPITSTEIPFNMATRMSDVLNEYDQSSVPRIDENGFLIEEAPLPKIKFFKAVYKRNLKNLVNQLQQTEDYALMFKYLFPIDKMLSINNIYSNVYLSTIKNVDTVFDATKEELRQLLFILLDSGNYEKSNCAPSNRDFMESLLNGFDIKGLAGQITAILLKSSILIFKGFMETADINILLSRRIIDLIHTVNQTIAQTQQLVNQAGSAFVDTTQGLSDLGSSIYGAASDLAMGTSCKQLLGPGSCKTSSAMMPSRPPFEGLQPIEENFIPEPQIWAVSLALLPATIFAPFFFGPPLTLPYGFVYWALDYKPSPNWLNSTPPADWLDKLLSGGNTETTTYNPGSPNENCRADLGLPSPGANSSTLNDYYANQNPSPEDPTVPDLIGNEGEAIQGTSTATTPEPDPPEPEEDPEWGETETEECPPGFVLRNGECIPEV